MPTASHASLNVRPFSSPPMFDARPLSIVLNDDDLRMRHCSFQVICASRHLNNPENIKQDPEISLTVWCEAPYVGSRQPATKCPYFRITSQSVVLFQGAIRE